MNATKERQAWCCLHLKLCDPCLSALDVPWCEKALYKYSSFPFPRMYSERSSFHPNRFAFGGVIPERVNTIKTCCKCFQHSAEEYLKQPIASFVRVNQHGRICIPEKSLKCCMDVLQILGCELHQNAFGGRAPPGPAGEL